MWSECCHHLHIVATYTALYCYFFLTASKPFVDGRQPIKVLVRVLFQLVAKSKEHHGKEIYYRKVARLRESYIFPAAASPLFLFFLCPSFYYFAIVGHF